MTHPLLTRDWYLSDAPQTRFQARMGQGYRLARALIHNPLALVGLVIMLGLLIIAALAPWIAPYSPLDGSLANRLQAPSAAHWMGTDELGRDIFSRVIHGARITLFIVILVAVIAAQVGVTQGDGALLSNAAEGVSIGLFAMTQQDDSPWHGLGWCDRCSTGDQG